MKIYRYAALILLMFGCEAKVYAAPDEIQVYTDDMNEPGQAGVEIHLNYVPDGSRIVEHSGAIASHHRFQATPEFSYGITKEWEAGMYVPTAIAADGGAYANGLRLRMKYIRQQPEGSAWFWGLNTEFGYTAPRVTDSPWAMEIRPIIGLRMARWMLAFNPIIDVPLSNGGFHGAAFEPSVKVMREITRGVEVGLEHYSGLGPLRNLQGWRGQDHTVYAVADMQFKAFELNVGLGRGYHNAADDWVMKAIVALPFN